MECTALCTAGVIQLLLAYVYTSMLSMVLPTYGSKFTMASRGFPVTAWF